jgi:uncharacterized Zn-finger protein
MGYNSEPKWTNDIVLPNRGEMYCPYCGKVAGNADEVMSIMEHGDYYSPRHIPEKLVFTCDNVECPHCDEDYIFTLSLVVTAQFE